MNLGLPGYHACLEKNYFLYLYHTNFVGYQYLSNSTTQLRIILLLGLNLRTPEGQSWRGNLLRHSCPIAISQAQFYVLTAPNTSSLNRHVHIPLKHSSSYDHHGRVFQKYLSSYGVQISEGRNAKPIKMGTSYFISRLMWQKVDLTMFFNSQENS